LKTGGLHNNMKKLVLLIGIPGSGKTTLASTLIGKGFERLCADDIRLELYGNEAEQGNPKEVFTIFFERLESLLALNKDIVIDNTNVKFEHRQQIIDRANKFQYTDIQLWVLDVPLAVCLERNKKRERQVPEDVITNLFNTLNKHGRPKTSEGEIVTIKVGESGQWQFSFAQ
jgi:predicted kinase